jgi:hypothetical protein
VAEAAAHTTTAAICQSIRRLLSVITASGRRVRQLGTHSAAAPAQPPAAAITAAAALLAAELLLLLLLLPLPLPLPLLQRLIQLCNPR